MTDGRGGSRLARFREGFTDYLPLALVVGSYGVVFGILAVQSGLSVAETCLMSLIVFAGASQFMALPLIREGAAAWTLIVTALLINLRHLLYGLNIGRLFRGAGPLRLLVVSFGIVDENYAFMTLGPGRDKATPAYFLGTAFGTYFFWNLATLAGALLGSAVRSLDIRGLDFAAMAVFIALIGASLRRRRDWGTVAAAGILAWLVRYRLGGYWHLLIVGLAVPLAAAALGKSDGAADAG
jgi:4-azaleucine resistance transporter AzlC